jgi:protein O-GlcNAc transferase
MLRGCFIVCSFLVTLANANSFSEFPSLHMEDTEVKFASGVKDKIGIQMSAPEVAFFLRNLKDCTSYFEFGCGGSTIVAAAFGPSHMNITSVDSSEEWITSVKQDSNCKAKIAADQMKIDHIDIGPVGAWGHPTQAVQESKGAWYLYSQAISMAGGKYDMVLVDGRFRVACVLNTFLSNPSAQVLIHDFLQPEHHVHYKALLAVADVVQRVGTLVKLKKKSGITQMELMKMYAAYMHVPHRA